MTAIDASRCPICGNARVRLRFPDIYDDRYGYSGRFDLYICEACGHQFLDAVFSPEELSRLYTEFYPRSTLNLKAWRPHGELGSFRTWIGRERHAAFRWVPRGCKVLDIGCGFGQSLGYHRARGCEVQGVEADENIRRVAERFGFSVKVGLFRAADYPAEYFDYATLDQVIEHAADPLALLRDVRVVLRPGGTLFLSTPNGRSLMARLLGRRWVHLHTPYHLHLFSTPSLKVAAQAAGFRIGWCRQITKPRWYGYQWLHLLTRPAAGEPSLFWSLRPDWPWQWRIPKIILALMAKAGFNHGVSLLLDGAYGGDNLVAALIKERE